MTFTGPGSSVDSVHSGEGEVTGSLPGCDIPKSLKMVLAAPCLALKTYGVEAGLVNPVAGCDWVWYYVKWLGHDTSVRQHYKSEHWAPFRNQILVIMTEKLLKVMLNQNNHHDLWPGRHNNAFYCQSYFNCCKSSFTDELLPRPFNPKP